MVRFKLLKIITLPAVIGLLLLNAAPSYAQLAGDTTGPGDSCASYPNGATTVVADSDLDGASVVLICDGANWQAMAGSGGGGGGAWEFIADWNYSSGTNQIDFTDLGGYSHILIAGNLTAGAVDQQVELRLSTDNGTSFLTTGYVNSSWAGSAGVTDRFEVMSDSTNWDTGENVPFLVTLQDFNNSGSRNVIFLTEGSEGDGGYRTNASYDAIRIMTPANVTGGFIYVYGSNSSGGGGGASAIDDLSDVDLSAGIGNGHVLTFSSAAGGWVSAASSGGGGGSLTPATIEEARYGTGNLITSTTMLETWDFTTGTLSTEFNDDVTASGGENNGTNLCAFKFTTPALIVEATVYNSHNVDRIFLSNDGNKWLLYSPMYFANGATIPLGVVAQYIGVARTDNTTSTCYELDVEAYEWPIGGGGGGSSGSIKPPAPDAIECTVGNNTHILFLAFVDETNGDLKYQDPTADSSSTWYVRWNSDGSYDTMSNYSGADCLSQTFDQLDAAGKAYYFGGGGGASNLPDLGDVDLTAGIGDGHVLTYSSAAGGWAAAAAGGGDFWVAGTGTDIYYNADAEADVGIGGAPPAWLDSNSTNDLYVDGIVYATDHFVTTASSQVADGQRFVWGDWSTSILGSSTTDYIIFNTNGAERIRLTSAGNLGIGTTSPPVKLRIASDTASLWTTDLQRSDNANRLHQAFVPNGAASPTNMIWMHGVAANQNRYSIESWDGSSQNTFLVVDAEGDVGIGKTTPGVALDVVGDIHYTGQLVDQSDIRMKYDIEPLESPLAKLTSLNGFSFKMKGDENEAIEYGVSAQDVQKAFPELVSTMDENGTLGVSYQGLIAPMIEAIKAQQQQIESQNAEIEELRAMVKELRDAKVAPSDL